MYKKQTYKFTNINREYFQYYINFPTTNSSQSSGILTRNNDVEAGKKNTLTESSSDIFRRFFDDSETLPIGNTKQVEEKKSPEARKTEQDESVDKTKATSSKEDVKRTQSDLESRVDFSPGIVSVLEQLREIGKSGIGSDPRWTFSAGQPFSGDYDQSVKIAAGIKNYLKTQAGLGKEGHAAVNKFLSDNGFPELQLREQPDVISTRDGELRKAAYAATIFKVVDKWDIGQEASSTKLKLDGGTGKEVDAVEMKKAEYYEVGGQTVVKAKLANGFSIFMVKQSPHKSRVGDISFELSNKIKNASAKTGKVIFPMADLRMTGSIPTGGGLLKDEKDPKNHGYELTELLLGVDFKMNEIGAKVEAAAAGSMVYTAAYTPEVKEVKIDGSFIAWIEKDGTPGPIASAYMTEKEMKRPDIKGL